MRDADPIHPAGLGRALRDAVRQLIVAHGTLDAAKRPCGTPLPVPHAWALLELLAHGPLTVGSLAARLNIDRTNVSRLCARMVQRGEVVRAPHPHDRRARLIELTDADSAAHFQEISARLADPDAIRVALLTLIDALGSGTAADHLTPLAARAAASPPQETP